MFSTAGNRVLVLLSAALLIAWAAFAYAQARPDARPVPSLLVSGNDIGFRVEGYKGTAVIGRFVVRIDGRWVDVVPRFGPKILTAAAD
jgi:hypothetical protein